MEEIELQQGTPEVQKNLWNWKYVANEISGFKTGPIREEAWRNSAPEVQWTSGVPDTEVQLPFLQMCVALQKFTSRAHRKFFLRPGGALHMYMALRLFNLHIRCALLQFNFLSVFTSCEQTLKIHIVPTEAQKNLNTPRVY
jgi:hypothetical protein